MEPSLAVAASSLPGWPPRRRTMAGDPTIALALEGQLRLDDQPALHRAVALARQRGARLLVLACRPEGQRLRGPHQRRLEGQALASLHERLAAAGIPLLAFHQHTTAAALAELRPLLQPEAVLQAEESRLFDTWPVAAERFPLVFSPFRRGLERDPEPPLPPPDLAGLGHPWDELPRSWLVPPAPPPVAPGAGSDPRSAFPFAGDEPTALARLQHYLFGSSGLRDYKATRNGLVGTEFSAKFSPFLGVGALSVRRIWREVLRYQALHGTDEGSEWMKQELLWREFFLWSEQKHGDAFHAPGGLQKRPPDWVEDQERFVRWTRGDAGHPLIDAQLNELLATGYLSNRGRQWVASHFVNELRLPWIWGARFFEWALIDAHPALNTGNWAYLAGVGSDPRSFGGAPRRFDLERQVGLYDPERKHLRLWGAAESRALPLPT
ncbi:deoxyribodipyrimidine photo-lyase [Cyanobium sp. N.Huapi 1H5]|uniref:FAD-binding domain-containing protein n=1 Tax=Cyanobium sp. N.Huapi 1H5 TaxID=2823719 RepID=UPI0020CD90E8|nr:FAD-binding domain-containing protein [Cyanobium sp. N.Huapi 1H5]MCP9837239.1 deoxyribodipyrimidine photo-lyase [Cyanobium sp. N.Huapi 1H5]